MSTLCPTENPLDAKVFYNLPFTYDLITRTAKWDETTLDGVPALVDFKEEKVTGTWQEGRKTERTNQHSRTELIQARPSGTGKVARILSFMDVTSNNNEIHDGFTSRAGRALISELFDPMTGEPSDEPSVQCAAAISMKPSITGSIQKAEGDRVVD